MNTAEEAVEYLKTVNLAEYLELNNRNISDSGMSVSCPFHNDSSPSAQIYNNDGHLMLKCFSDNCSFRTGTIIDIVKRQRSVDDSGAISFLLKYYNIEIDDSWIEKKKEMLTENISTIENLLENKDKYPDLYKCIRRISSDLIGKLRFAREKIIAQTRDGESLFFCSLREFKRISRLFWSGKGHNGQNLKVDRYCLLGLMKKLTEKDIPKAMWNRTQEEKKFEYHIQFYSIPEYTDDVLSQADETARTLKQFNASLNSISRGLVMKIFGKEKAQELYPQVESGELSESNKEFEAQVEKLLLSDIKRRGYGRISDIVEKMVKRHDWKTVTDKRIRRCLPGIILKHNLKSLSANKELKERYGIGGRGYPRIIVRKSDKVDSGVSQCSPDTPQTSTVGSGSKKLR